jgi:hypothetical protein
MMHTTWKVNRRNAGFSAQSNGGAVPLEDAPGGGLRDSSVASSPGSRDLLHLVVQKTPETLINQGFSPRRRS